MSQISSSFSFDFKDKNSLYFKLLKEEDFDFKTKNILINILNEKNLIVSITCDSILDMKIATSALIKSLEIIEKTLNV